MTTTHFKSKSDIICYLSDSFMRSPPQSCRLSSVGILEQPLEMPLCRLEEAVRPCG
ncbi:MAG: hypothetical protein RMY34_33830 [Aulosira sp. DedQUE10]|nr:hypothetical protein [Aulosira sp. DedQUE10]